MKMERVLTLYQVCIRMLHNTRTPHGPLRTSHKGRLSRRTLTWSGRPKQSRLRMGMCTGTVERSSHSSIRRRYRRSDGLRSRCSCSCPMPSV